MTIPAKALEQHIGILGKTGSGKTSTEKLIVEQVVHAGFRVCVLDTIKSDWWGITSSANGKSAGLPFRILGGPRGHVPLHSSAGKAIGQLVGAGKLPLSIIDMADFEAGGIQRFFVDFAPALLRSAKGVVYLVIEEAHELAPKERAGFGAENMAIHWAKKLATAGRSKGIRLVVATQRVQSLHNAVLGSCETMIAHRLTTPADQEPVVKWLKANTDKDTVAKVAASLSSLPTGTGWICSGEARIFEKMAFPKFKTYDNTATPTGDGVEHEVKTAAVDQDELRSIIGDAVKEAEANDPKVLKGRIAALERQIASKPVEKVSTGISKADLNAEYTRGRADGFDAGRLDEFNKWKGMLHTASGDLSIAVGALGRLDTILERRNDPMSAPKLTYKSTVPVAQSVERRPFKPQVAGSSPAGHANGSGNHLPVGEKAILRAAAQWPSGVDRDQLSVLTGYKRSSRDAYIARLKEKGFIATMGSNIEPTNAGIAALGSDYEPLPTGRALQDYWMAKLPEGEKRILEILIDNYPNDTERNALDDATGYKRSSRDAYLARLKARRLVDGDRGTVKASENLFA